MQVDCDLVAEVVLAKKLSQRSFDWNHVGAVTHREQGRLERMTVDGPDDFDWLACSENCSGAGHRNADPVAVRLSDQRPAERVIERRAWCRCHHNSFSSVARN